MLLSPQMTKQQLVAEMEGTQWKLEEEKRLLEEQILRDRKISQSLDASLQSPPFLSSNFLQEVMLLWRVLANRWRTRFNVNYLWILMSWYISNTFFIIYLQVEAIFNESIQEVRREHTNTQPNLSFRVKEANQICKRLKKKYVCIRPFEILSLQSFKTYSDFSWPWLTVSLEICRCPF